jgi:hypothetical protein
MPLTDEVIAVLTRWKQVSEFTAFGDWIFASPWKLGRQTVSYFRIWRGLSLPAKLRESDISARIRPETLSGRNWVQTGCR